MLFDFVFIWLLLNVFWVVILIVLFMCLLCVLDDLVCWLIALVEIVGLMWAFAVCCFGCLHDLWGMLRYFCNSVVYCLVTFFAFWIAYLCY